MSRRPTGRKPASDARWALRHHGVLHRDREGFTAADLAAVSLLQGVRPVDGYVEPDPATLRARTREELDLRERARCSWPS